MCTNSSGKTKKDFHKKECESRERKRLKRTLFRWVKPQTFSRRKTKVKKNSKRKSESKLPDPKKKKKKKKNNNNN